MNKQRDHRGGFRKKARFVGNIFLPLSELSSFRSESRNRTRSIGAMWRSAMSARSHKNVDEAGKVHGLDEAARRRVIRSAWQSWAVGLVFVAVGAWMGSRIFQAAQFFAAVNYAAACVGVTVVGCSIALRAARDRAMASAGQVISWREFLRRPRWWVPFGTVSRNQAMRRYKG